MFLSLHFLETFLHFHLRKKTVHLSLNVWYNSPVKPSGSGHLFGGSFLLLIQFHYQ